MLVVCYVRQVTSQIILVVLFGCCISYEVFTAIEQYVEFSLTNFVFKSRYFSCPFEFKPILRNFFVSYAYNEVS